MENNVITHHPQPESVRALRKELLRILLPDAQPAARMERLARSLGFASDAACTAHMRTTPHQPLHARRALELLENVGRGDPLGFVVEAACSALYHDGTLAQWGDPKALMESVTAGKILALAGADPAALRSEQAPGPEEGGQRAKNVSRDALVAGMIAGGDPWQRVAHLEPALRWFAACQTAYAIFPHGSAVDVKAARQTWAYTLMLVPGFLDGVQKFGHLYDWLKKARPSNDVWAEQTQPWLYTAYRGLVSLIEQQEQSRGNEQLYLITVFEAVRTVGAHLAQGRWMEVPQRVPQTNLLGITL